MQDSIRLALLNIIRHGDTDIFPFPFENRAFFDNFDDTAALLSDYHKHFADFLDRYPPHHVNSLTPAGYNGFRWATQLDPIWNAYFLACVLSISEPIEAARIPKDQNIVFSYRYAPDPKTGDFFDRDFTWANFMSRSLELSNDFEYIVICDIAEFYPRVGHHRLENVLRHVDSKTDIPSRIMTFLSHFTHTRSLGLPIGGPASRILSEITLNQVDRLLKNAGIVFVRYADDYHLFAKDRNQAYQQLIFLSEKLFDNQGLSLQKSKTRIITTSEFTSTSPIQLDDTETAEEVAEAEVEEILPPRSLFRFSIAFDPYSETAEEDYSRLKEQLKRFDIMSLLKSELQKTRIHAALARKIVQAVRYLDDGVRDDAIRSILDNSEVSYPIFSSVLILLDQVFDDLSEETQDLIVKRIRDLITENSAIMRVDLHVAFAVRVLAHKGDEETQVLLQQLYEKRTSPLIRRDIILSIARWREWYWLSDLKNRFQNLSGPEKRAFIVASYTLRDEGHHWRDHTRDAFTPFEGLVRNWAANKAEHDT